VDVAKKLDELLDLVENARSMPMSASCVVNRQEMMERLDELRGLLPEELNQASRLLGDKDAVLAEGRREAERVLAHAREERGALIADTEVAREAYGEAERILAEARADAERIRGEADDYVDQKLANFEVVLTKTLGAVGRGRDKMRGRRSTDDLKEYLDEQDSADARRGAPDLAAQLDRRDDEGFAGLGAIPAQPAAPPAQQQVPAYDTGGYPAVVPQQGGYDQAAYGDGYGYDTGQNPVPDYSGQQPAYTGGYDQSGYDQGYDTGSYPPPATAQPQYPGPGQGQGYDNAPLDETSFFDTSLIDLRQIEQQQRDR
jgi:cell division septum initiation protein DivIVA